MRLQAYLRCQASQLDTELVGSEIGLTTLYDETRGARPADPASVWTAQTRAG